MYNSIVFKYVLGGISLGLIFSLLHNFTSRYFTSYHTFIINLAPLLFGLLALISGINHAKLKTVTDNLEEEVEKRTKELKVYFRVVEQAPFSVVITDTEGNIEYVNPYFCQLTGYTRQEAEGANPRILKSEVTPKETYEELWQTILSGKTWRGEFINKRKDQTNYWEAVVIVPITNRKGSISKFVAIKENISDLRKTEKLVSDQLTFINKLLDEIPNPIFFKDARGEFIGCNKAYEKALGISRHHLVGKTIMEIEGMSEVERLKGYEEDMLIIQNKQKIHKKLQMTFADGKKHQVLYWSSGFPLSDGSPGGLISVIVDISELKEKEEALLQAYKIAQEATAAKSMFLANMSHEIRTPMNAIIGMAYLALKTDLTAKQRNYVEKIHYAATSLLGIINDILDFSKIESGKMHIEHINFVLDNLIFNIVNVISLKAAEKNLEFLYRVKPDVPQNLLGDPLRLGQIISNLVDNAVKFTERGEITVEIEKIQQTGNRVQLQFVVQDTGIGMSEEQTRNLFQAFTQADGSTTRKYGGTGLGLAISKRLVEMMDGTIGVESQPNVGSRFSFTAWLDLDSIQQPLALPKTLNNLRILVVDDSLAAREILVGHLEIMKFRANAVASGEDAIKAIEKAAFIDPYAAVFMDWKMPVMDGLETAYHIQNMPNVLLPKIIIVTAFEKEELLQKKAGIEIADVLIKPVNASLLFNTLMRLFALGQEKVQQKSLLEEKKYSFNGIKVLLAEDNEINQQIVVELLENQGVEVEVVSNGKAAVNKILEANKESFYDLIFMDLHMPEMDGFEATKLIRKFYPQLPIVALTARVMVEEKERCLNNGMNDHIPKPIDPQLLFSVLSKWTKKGEMASNRKDNEDSSIDFSTIPGLNWQEGLSRVMGNSNLYRKLLHQYIGNQQDTVNKIWQALEKGNTNAAAETTHTLKGVSSNIGAWEIQSLSIELEEGIMKEQSLEELQPLLESIEKKLYSLMKAVENNIPMETNLVQTVTKGKLTVFLDKLRGLLENSDCESLDYFADIRSGLMEFLKQEQILELEKLIENFEFETALLLIQKIKEEY